MAPFPAIKSEIDFAELVGQRVFILENANVTKKELPVKADRPDPLRPWSNRKALSNPAR